MKLSLPLTIQEIKSLAYICKYLGGAPITDYVGYGLATSMSGLAEKLIRKLHTCYRQRKYSVAFDDMQVFAMYVLSFHVKRVFGAYEKALMEKIVAEIDKKYQYELAIKNSLKSN